jgi:WD40 repeat protein
LASGGSDGSVRLWDAASGETLGGPLVEHDDWVSDLAFHPNGTLLASGGRDGRVVVWDVETRRPQARLRAHGDWVTGVAFDASGEVLASGARDGTILLWDTATWSVLGEITEPDGGEVLSLDVSPDG